MECGAGLTPAAWEETGLEEIDTPIVAYLQVTINNMKEGKGTSRKTSFV